MTFSKRHFYLVPAIAILGVLSFGDGGNGALAKDAKKRDVSLAERIEKIQKRLNGQNQEQHEPIFVSDGSIAFFGIPVATTPPTEEERAAREEADSD